MTCPSCGAGVPEGARFCPACGNALVARPDERRVATVLFADLVGFTTFSEAADPEQVKNLVDRCFDRLAADVTAFGGRVDKIVGDALVALFGAPVAHEDDPERAVRSALALQESMAAFCAEHDVDVRLRIGVNTGEVLVGGFRAGDDYTAMGDVVNTASRLQVAAAPGDVLVGEATHLATRSVIRYEAAGALAVRGRSEPVTAWVARGVLTRPGRRATRGGVALVGRDRELGLLRESVAAAGQRRRALLLLVVGEAGVGKSRIATEIPRVGTLRSTRVLVGHCVPYGEPNVWAPVGDALHQALRSEHDEEIADDALHAALGALLGLPHDSAETTRVAAGLLPVLGRADASADVDPGRARDEVLRALHAVFEALTDDSLVVLGLADLHWADDAILELVDVLLTRLRDRPFVVLATARPELAERWSPSTRHETTVVHLDPLDDVATATLIRSHLGAETPDPVVALLLERSGGNPFFIEELAALAEEADVDLLDLATRTSPEERAATVPATLRGLVAARLDALDAPVRDLVEDCAVIGSAGALRLLDALARSRGELDAEARLDELAARDLVRRSGAEWSFPAELVREIAYGTLTKAERARRHAVVAEALAADPDPTTRETDRLEQLAFHYGRAAGLAVELGRVDAVPADVHERAVAAHDDAARHAERSESWTRAHRHFTAAMEHASTDDPCRVERLLGRARALVERHELTDARRDIDQALASADLEVVQRIRGLLVLGRYEQRRGDHEASVVAYDDAIALAREVDDQLAVAEGLRGRGLALMFRGELDGAEDAIGLALDLFQAADERRGEAWALQNLAWIAFTRGEPTLADERLAAAIDRFTALRDWGGLDWAMGLLAWVRFIQGRLDDAEEIAEGVLARTDESGDRWALGMLGVLRAQVALWRGHPVDALDQSAGARERFAGLEDRYGTVQSLIPAARALACLGRLGEAAATVETMAEVAGGTELAHLPRLLSVAIGCHLGDGGWRVAGPAGAVSEVGITAEEQGIVGGLARLQAGEIAAARAALERSYREASTPSAVAAAGGILAMARSADGDAAEALALTDELATIEVGSYLDRLQAWMARALAAARLGGVAEALDAAARAVAMADATESLLDHAITRLARAVVLARVEDPGAEAARHEVRGRLEALGTSAEGWTRVFELAAQPVGTTARST